MAGYTEAVFDEACAGGGLRLVARTGLTDLLHLSGVVSLIWRRPVRHADGRIILTALCFQLASTGGCDPVEFVSGVLAVGWAKSKRPSHIPLRAWVDFTCACNGTLPARDGHGAIYPQSRSHN